MIDTTCGSRFRGLTAFLVLLLAFTATACNGGPTRPSADDRVRLYTGRWRGNINGLEIVLDMQAGHDFLIGLDGTGTARNPVTGEIHRLDIWGIGEWDDAQVTEFSLDTAYETGPGGVILGGGKNTGQFRGAVSRDGRTWPGQWTSTTHIDGAPIFGPGQHPVTLIKE